MTGRRGINPCLICAEEATGPKGGTVCPECVRKVNAYDELRAKTVTGTVAVRLPAYPSIPGGKHDFNVVDVAAAHADPSTNARGRLELLLRELRRALDKPAQRWSETLPGEGNRLDVKPRLSPSELTNWRTYDRTSELYNVPEALAQVLVDLDPFLHAAFRESEEDGKRQGSNLLASLAAGDLTNSDFERRAGIARDKG